MSDAEGLLTFIIGFVIGAIVLSFVLNVVFDNATNDMGYRALSCMGNGNTIGQCETVLGLPQTTHGN